MTDMLAIPAGVRSAETPDFVTLPGGPAWDDARRAWNLAVDQRPSAVATPRTAQEVRAAVRWARARGLRVAAQGTGHNGMALGSLDGALLLKTHEMRQVTVDPESLVARAQAGALWADVLAATSEHRLAALAGSAHDVGVVGYMLGGGVSFLARRYGLAANRVLAVELVNAEGELIRADRADHPDLFWALRGGGGSFGVVTAIEFELFDLPTVYAGTLFFGIERAAEVLHAWREWTYTAPESVTSVGRILRFPDFEEVPEPLRGGAFAVVEAVFTEGEAEGAELMAPLRALGPDMDTLATIPVQDLIHLHMDPPGPVPGLGDHQMLGRLPAEAIDAAVAVAGPGGTEHVLSFEIRHVGGAAGRPNADHGALSALAAEYLTFTVGMTPDAEAMATVRGELAQVRAAMAPWAIEREYLNFSEHPDRNPAIFYDEDVYNRLRAIKTAVDPGDAFQGNHHIRPL